MSDTVSRRRLFTTGAGLAAVPTMVACGDGAGDGGAGGGSTPASEPAAKGTVLASTSDIPVGGCAVFPDEGTVVTQPTEGDFRAFSATCTHQGCLLGSSSEGTIPCACHGSAFALTDGAPLEGPADEPLPEVAIEVEGGRITIV